MITSGVVMKMVCEAYIQNEQFEVDTFEALLGKFKKLREEENLADEETKNRLTEQIEEAIEACGKGKTHLATLKVFLGLITAITQQELDQEKGGLNGREVS